MDGGTGSHRKYTDATQYVDQVRSDNIWGAINSDAEAGRNKQAYKYFVILIWLDAGFVVGGLD
jgi:hypothetical protein